MRNLLRVAQFAVVLGLIAFTSACVVSEPREGYWDRDQNRYYHEHAWHACTPADSFCH